MFISWVGYYYFSDRRSYEVVTEDIKDAFITQDFTPTWAFHTLRNHRIRFKFHHMYFDDRSVHLEIGDGVRPGISTRLVVFYDITLPDDVISISNAAWLRVIYSRSSKLRS